MASSTLMPGARSRFRNIGRRLGFLSAPSADEEPVGHLEREAIFEVSRVAVVSGRRYLQFSDGRGWVPECSRKKEGKVVVQFLEGQVAEDSDCALPQPLPKAGETLRYLCVAITATRSTNTPSTQIAQIALRAGGKLLDMQGFTVASLGGDSPPSEQPLRLLAPKGKWLDLNFRMNGQSVLLLSSTAEFHADDIAFRTASDAPPRDPIGLRVHGSLDGYVWTPLCAFETDLYSPKLRMAWTPWFQLRADPAVAAEADGGEQEGTIEQGPLPAELSWWRALGNADAYLEVRPAKVRRHLSAGTCFAASRIKTVSGQRYLQLPEGLGWLPECCRQGSSQATAVPLQGVPELMKLPEALPVPASRKRLRDGSQAENEQGAAGVLLPSSSVRLKYLRLVVLGTRTAKVVSVQLGQLCLRHNGKVLSLDRFDISNPQGQSPANELAQRVLIEGGKWLDLNFSTNQRSVLLLEAPDTFTVDDMSLCTASDNPSRDPVSFRVDGSCNGRGWVVLFESGESFPMPTERRAWSPWLALEVQGPAPDMLGLGLPLQGKMRYTCYVPGCTDTFAVTEGYIVKGKLLLHMQRKHPGAPETQALLEELAKERAEGTSQGGAAMDEMGPASNDEVGPAFDVDTEPITPTKQAEANTDTKDTPPVKMVASNSSKSSDTAKVGLGTLSEGCPVMVLRLTALASASIMGHVDIEADVLKVEPIRYTMLRTHPNQRLKMRRFLLKDGDASCFWVVFGAQADRYNEDLSGRRVNVRQAKVQQVSTGRHLTGCSHVDVLDLVCN